MTTPALPPELIKSIIDEFHGDKTSLASCSLISRNWTGFSQSQLFHSVSIRIQTGEDSLDAKLADFLALLETSPHIRCLVKNLHIANKGDGAVSSFHLGPGTVFVSFLQTFDTLYTLILERIFFPSPTSPWEPVKPLSSLKTLKLRYVDTQSGSLHLLLLFLSPSEQLYLVQVSERVLTIADSMWTPPPLNLRVRQVAVETKVRNRVQHSFLELSKQWSLTRLEDLSIDIDTDQADPCGLLSQLDQVLARNGTRLRYLRLTVYGTLQNPPSWNAPHLVTLTPNLEILHILFGGYRESESFSTTKDEDERISARLSLSPPSTNFIVQVIRAAPRSLQQLTLDIGHNPSYANVTRDAEPWRRIHNALRSLSPSTLVRIVTRDTWKYFEFDEPLVPLRHKTQRLVSRAIVEQELFENGFRVCWF